MPVFNRAIRGKTLDFLVVLGLREGENHRKIVSTRDILSTTRNPVQAFRCVKLSGDSPSLLWLATLE